MKNKGGGVRGPLPVDGEAKMTAEHSHTEVLYHNAISCYGVGLWVEGFRVRVSGIRVEGLYGN
jgi:hypothetical protein